MLGLNRWLLPIDDATRTPFTPYGLSGIMLGAAIVFFAFIGFDSISTHAEEAKRPQRDVPIGILTSLLLCTILYMAVAAGHHRHGSLSGHQHQSAHRRRLRQPDEDLPGAQAAIIAVGGLAGMTSVLLVLFLSQARIFMAMARDGLLPQVFGKVHPRFRTPHVATIVTGVVICLVAAFTPIYKLEEMVNVGTLMAFVMVCAAVLVLRVQRPDVKRPFRCPLIWVVAPLGMLVNLSLMLFLPIDTWLRLVIWLAIGMAIYFLYSRRHSLLTRHLLHEVQMPLSDEGYAHHETERRDRGKRGLENSQQIDGRRQREQGDDEDRGENPQVQRFVDRDGRRGKLDAVGEFVAAPFATAEVLRAERLVAGRADQERRFERIGRRSVRRCGVRAAQPVGPQEQEDIASAEPIGRPRRSSGPGSAGGKSLPAVPQITHRVSRRRPHSGQQGQAELMSTVAASSGAKGRTPVASREASLKIECDFPGAGGVGVGDDQTGESRPTHHVHARASLQHFVRDLPRGCPPFPAHRAAGAPPANFGHGRFPKIRA